MTRDGDHSPDGDDEKFVPDPTYPVPDEPSRSGSDETDGTESGVDGWRRLLLGGSMAVSGLLTTPVLLIVCLLIAITGTLGSARALSRTDGLEPLTYGGAFWMAAGALLVGLVGSVSLRLLGGDDEKTWPRRLAERPSILLLLLFVLPALTVVPIESSGIDLPDTMTTALLLGSTAYAWLVVPLAVFGLAWKIGKKIFDWAQTSRFRAGVLTGSTPLVASGLLFVATCGGIAVEGSQSEPLQLEEPLEDDVEQAEGPVEGSLNLMTTLSKTSETASEFSSEEQRRFDECMERIYGDGTEDSPYGKAVQRIRRRSHTSSADAEDVVSLALLDTCERHATHPLRSVVRYFNKVVKNAANDAYENQTRYELCGLEVEDESPFRANIGERNDNEVIDFKDHFCELPDDKQQVLHMRGIGVDYEDMADRLDISDAAARKRVSRARQKLSDRLDK